NLTFEEINVVLYIVNIIISITISLSIINSLYISKKYTKEINFHLYNNLFSWEMFFIFTGIVNLIEIFSILSTNDNETFNLFLKIRILIIYFAFWFKIIHFEKIMEKITYKRHHYIGIIPFTAVLILGIADIPIFILIVIFVCTSLFPFIFILLYLRNTGVTNIKTLKISIGSLLIGLGIIFKFDLIEFLTKPFSIISPIFYIIGSLLIIDSFRKELFSSNRNKLLKT
ncbi:MAG: hypothetical protein KGD57_01055, partial [Candidatus Lokiarchaeota archaeon]|nr:hypothetical protein [Candidatus Lokiarchaeota archaeon]